LALVCVVPFCTGAEELADVKQRSLLGAGAESVAALLWTLQQIYLYGLC